MADVADVILAKEYWQRLRNVVCVHVRNNVGGVQKYRVLLSDVITEINITNHPDGKSQVLA